MTAPLALADLSLTVRSLSPVAFESPTPAVPSDTIVPDSVT